MSPWTQRFLDLAHAQQALRFGQFTLKSGRQSPYFFNAGAFNDGAAIDGLARCYAEAIAASDHEFDMLFGPAYKGIPLVSAIAISLFRDHDINLPFAFNRKEAKAHGEGGQIVGAPLQGRVLIVDDVISAGTSVTESVQLISQAGAQAGGVAIALDRQERGQDSRSAVSMVRASGLEVIAIATLSDLITWLDDRRDLAEHRDSMAEYQSRFGA
nr:orotate phosphoribosyltransferase [Wenzhouxiangella sp. AB-CW3]